LAAGVAIAYWEPGWSLLTYWLVLTLILGVVASVLPSLSGLNRRAKWLVANNAFIVAFALATTQCAARRVISSTHLQYRGVHVAGVDSFTVGVGDSAADVRLETVAAAPPWTARIVRRSDTWTIEPLAGVEQLRLSPLSASGRPRALFVAQSGILRSADDWIAVVDPAGAVVDTLRLRARLVSARGDTFLLDPVSRDIGARYARRLRAGVALSSLDGRRAMPSPYERFVRAQSLSASDVVNGAEPGFAARYLGWLLPRSTTLLVAASPPYTLRGAAMSGDQLAVRDSALIEVRSGEASWRFELRERRREPSADPGLDLLFIRNPRPLDTPLPAGMSCRDGAACGAISLRRLPPPVAHIALDFAGFDPNRFGMLGRVEEEGDGVNVVLARQTYHLERGSRRPVAIPVTPLQPAVSLASNAVMARHANRYWVLLDASGTFGDDSWTILLIGLGLALLLWAIYSGVRASSPSGAALEPRDERWLTLGATAVIALLLARLIIGARVKFFSPYLERALDTAVGLWVAIAIVVVGLLSWSAWLPPLLANARALLGGQRSLRHALLAALRLPAMVWRAATAPRARVATTLTLAALACLGVARFDAVVRGVGTGLVVLSAWVTLAWVTAFAAPYFETFERGAWSVIEQLAPSNRLPAPRAGTAGSRGRARFEKWHSRIPELPVIAACLLAELALLPHTGAVIVGAAFVALAGALVIALRRRASGGVGAAPDYWSTFLGAALFAAVIGRLRSSSQSGSMAAFVLVVFVALVSVRIGRGVGARADALRVRPTAERSADWTETLVSSVLLVSPFLLLAPLMLIDMGLFLVVVVPIGFATLLAAGRSVAGWRLAAPAAAALLLFGVLTPRVLFPSVRAIRDADSHAAQAAAFQQMTEVFGLPVPIVRQSMDRVAARSVATADRGLAEALLIAAKPGGARDLLVPSIEQIWGGRTYASAGLWGSGLGRAAIGGRGVAESVSYAEDSFSVFVLAEHGMLGGLLVLALYLLLTLAVGSTAMSGSALTPGAYRASRALFLVATLVVAIPAAYVALSNLGVVPITGQNMPFLGLNAWSDVALCAGVVGILVTGAVRRSYEAVR
jgi:hypothetical protein